MKVCGFTFIRNAEKYDYPVVESISSILPLCDRFIVVCGNSVDRTRRLVGSIMPSKIEIIDSIWDDSVREGGRTLAVETNKAIDALPGDYDWAFYLQADEVVHEKYHAPIIQSMKKWEDDEEVEGLLFNYVHFYGSYDYVGDSTRWYRHEVRIIRPDKSIQSFRDAQGFRKNNRMLKVRPANAAIYHYGWVKPPEKQQAKQQYFHSLWHDDRWLRENVGDHAEFDYSAIDSLAKFEGSHPGVMQQRIAKRNWKFEYNPARKKLAFKTKIKLFVEKLTGWRPGEYINYKLLK